MTRREFLATLKNTLLTISCGSFLSGCEVIERGAYSSRPMAYCLAYIIFGNSPPAPEVRQIENILQAAGQNSPGLQARLERIYFDIMVKALPASFESVSAEGRKNILNKMLPVLLEQPEIMSVLDQYLDDQNVLKVMDYPNLPGSFGECGWLVLEGEVWERYYGK